MHDSVREFIAQNGQLLTPPVLNIGSYDVNGSIRDLLPMPDRSWGVDIVAGPGVEEVYNGRDLPLPRPEQRYGDSDLWGAVVCTEVYEHLEDPIAMTREILRVLQPGGWALITARAPGFAMHDSPDRWRYMPGALSEIFDREGQCRCMEWPDWQCPGVFVRAIKPS